MSIRQMSRRIEDPGRTGASQAYEQRWKILGVLALSLLIIGLDNTVLNVALPTLQTHFAASHQCSPCSAGPTPLTISSSTAPSPRAPRALPRA